VRRQSTGARDEGDGLSAVGRSTAAAAARGSAVISAQSWAAGPADGMGETQ
jgi:hypothetical protein